MTVSPAAPGGAVGAVAALPSGLRLAAAPAALDQLLARVACDHDQAAFARLYTATRGKLFSTVLLIVRRRDLAEDVIQEVYARIWLNASSYRSSAGSPMTWMITVARNLAIDWIRKHSRENHADDAELLALPSDSPSAVETLEAAEEHSAAIAQRQQMLRALQALDPIRRDLLIAAYLHGESRAELSKRAGVPVNTVKTWIRRAVLEIQKSMRNAEATNSPVPAGAERDRNPKPVTLPPARQLKTGARPAHPF